METLKKSLNLPLGLHREVEDFISRNPGITFTLVANQAIKEWLKSPQIKLSQDHHFNFSKCDPRKRGFIKDLVDIGASEVNADLVILFGSQSRGDWRQGSDIDLLYVIPDDVQKKPKSSQIIKALKKSGVNIDFDVDILIVRQKIYDLEKNNIEGIIANAIKGGEVVFRRS